MARAAPPYFSSQGCRIPPCRPSEGGGILATPRRRPSSIQAGIASGSALTARHRTAFPRERLIELTLTRALQDARDLGQQIAAPGC